MFGNTDFQAAATRIEVELEALAREPSYHCMLRHLLESALRIARLATLHDQQARDLSLRGTSPLSSRLLRLHLLGLASATRLDRRAKALQERGVAIIEQDVSYMPPVPGRLERSES